MNPEIQDAKRSLRREMKALRASMPVEERTHIDEAIMEQLFQLPVMGTATLVLTYLSFGSEVDTHNIVRRAFREGKRVALPRVCGNHLEWHLVDGLFDTCENGANNAHQNDVFERSSFGMYEPPARDATRLKLTDKEIPTSVALVPGLAFSPQGYRLGYGGGFYDRFLPDYLACGGTAVGICRSVQIVPRVPVDSFDVRLDAVVTESDLYEREAR